MGRLARVLSFVRAVRNEAKVSDVKIDPGGGANITGEHFADAGDDAFPLDTDYVVTTEIDGTGREEVVGYLDPLNTPKATTGDKRIYARDPSTGAAVVELWLKSDGSAILSNALGSAELQANGDFVVNGVTIAANGAVDIPSSLVVDGKEHAGHGHPQANDSDGNTEADTGPNI